MHAGKGEQRQARCPLSVPVIPDAVTTLTGRAYSIGGLGLRQDDPLCAFHPDPRAVTPPRFHCDEMLFRLARWLRAAGYDATLAEPGEPDAAVLARAVDEERWLVTRDHAPVATAGGGGADGPGRRGHGRGAGDLAFPPHGAATAPRSIGLPRR